jgi:hypothetical protein
LRLLADWNLASYFVEEVFREDYLVLRLLAFRCLDWRQSDDALAVGREIVVGSDVRDSLLGPPIAVQLANIIWLSSVRRGRPSLRK